MHRFALSHLPTFAPSHFPTFALLTFALLHCSFAAFAGQIAVTKDETSHAVSETVDFTGTVTLSGTISATGNVTVDPAAALTIPQGTAPTVNAAGETAVDTNGDGSTITQGVITYYDGTQQLTAAAFDAYPTTDEQRLEYDSGTNKLVWVSPRIRTISQVVAFGSFTDNTDATGYIDLATQLPAGAIPLGVTYLVSTGFTGDTTAVVQTGVAGDLDRFASVTDQSVLAAATVGHGVPADAVDGIAAAQTIRVTVTGSTDFTSISAGSMTVTVVYCVP